jgi:hypothetical protein
MSAKLRKQPIDLDVQRRMREAHVLRSQYMSAKLRALVGSLRLRLLRLARTLARQVRERRISQPACAAKARAEADRS